MHANTCQVLQTFSINFLSNTENHDALFCEQPKLISLHFSATAKTHRIHSLLFTIITTLIVPSLPSPYTGLISPSLPPFNPIPIAQRKHYNLEIQIEINGIEFIPIYIPHFIVQNYFIVLNRSWVYALKMSIKSILEMVPAFYMMGVHHL